MPPGVAVTHLVKAQRLDYLRNVEENGILSTRKGEGKTCYHYQRHILSAVHYKRNKKELLSGNVVYRTEST